MKKSLLLLMTVALFTACGEPSEIETPTTDSTYVDSLNVDTLVTSVDTVKVDTTAVKTKADSLKK